MVGSFHPHRTPDADARIRHIETFLMRIGAVPVDAAVAAQGAKNAGTAGAAGGSGGGSGGAGVLAGDVTGPAAANTVALLQGQLLTISSPATGDLVEWDGSAFVNTRTLHGTLTLDEGVNLALGTTTGTKIGTAANQKLGLWGATPVGQRPNTTDLRQVAIDIGALASGGATPLDLNGGMLTAGTVTTGASFTVRSTGELDANGSAGVSGQFLKSQGISASAIWADLPLDTDSLATLSDVSLSGVAQGDILYRGAATWNNLAHGIAGQVLTTNGAAANPSWTTFTPDLTNAVILAPGSDTRNRIQATGDFIPLSLRAAVGQTHDLFVAYASDGTTKLTRLTSDGTISSPGAGAGSEHFGLAAAAAGSNATACGPQATAAGTNSLACGYLASAGFLLATAVGGQSGVTNASGTALGAQASAADAATAVGQGATASGSQSLSLGVGSSASGSLAIAAGASAVVAGASSIGFGVGASNNAAHDSCILLGRNATSTAAHQMVMTDSSTFVSDVYWNGVTAAAPVGVALHASGGSGSNITGANLTLAGGKGTGSAGGGDVIFQSTYAGGAGSSLNALHELARFSQLGVLSLTQLTSIQDRTAFDLTPSWTTATDASRKARAIFNIWDTAAREAIRVEASGSAAMLGFLGASAVVRPSSYALAGSATRTFPTDPSALYAGLDNLQPGTPYAKLSDLNTLRGAVSSLEGVVRQLVTDLASTSGYGLLAAA